MSGHTKKAGLILAAGFGSRLSANGHGTLPKPLISVGGTPLIVRALNGLEVAGCDKAVIVLGFEPDEIREAVLRAYSGALDVEFVLNDRYDLKNGVSVLAARELVGEQFVLVMADHVVSDDVMRLAGSHTPPADGATLLVDYRIDQVFDLDDATKVVESEGRIVHIGKQLSAYNCVDIGVFVCTGGLLEALDQAFCAAGDVSLSEGVQHLAADGRMRVLDIGDGFWQDVDTPEMLAHVKDRLAITA